MLMYRGAVYRATFVPTTSMVPGPQGDGILIEMFILPPELRGQGKGASVYRAWENSLDKSIRFVYVIPIKESHMFWKKMGFVPAYIAKDDEGDLVDLLLVKDRRGKRIVPIEFNPDQYDLIQGVLI